MAYRVVTVNEGKRMDKKFDTLDAAVECLKQDYSAMLRWGSTKTCLVYMAALDGDGRHLRACALIEVARCRRIHLSWWIEGGVEG